MTYYGSSKYQKQKYNKAQRSKTRNGNAGKKQKTK